VSCALGFAKLRGKRQARAIWKAAHALELRGLPAPLGLALLPEHEGEDLGAWWLLSSTLWGESKGTPAPSLDGLASGSPRPPGLETELGRYLARLHLSGLRHRDLKGDNLRLAGDRLHLVDLDGLRRIPPGRTEAAAIGDLGRLLAWWRFQALPRSAGQEASTILRFWRAYLRERRNLSGSLPDMHRLAEGIELGCLAWRQRHQAGSMQPSP